MRLLIRTPQTVGMLGGAAIWAVGGIVEEGHRKHIEQMVKVLKSVQGDAEGRRQDRRRKSRRRPELGLVGLIPRPARFLWGPGPGNALWPGGSVVSLICGALRVTTGIRDTAVWRRRGAPAMWLTWAQGRGLAGVKRYRELCPRTPCAGDHLITSGP
jgi:hypothetical protein